MTIPMNSGAKCTLLRNTEQQYMQKPKLQLRGHRPWVECLEKLNTYAFALGSSTEPSFKKTVRLRGFVWGFGPILHSRRETRGQYLGHVHVHVQSHTLYAIAEAEGNKRVSSKPKKPVKNETTCLNPANLIDLKHQSINLAARLVFGRRLSFRGVVLTHSPRPAQGSSAST